MVPRPPSPIDEQRIYARFAAAYVRSSHPELARGSDREVIQRASAAGVRLHRYKRTALLPRVRRVLGILQGIHPESLLDVGSGRGAFLWPLLEAFPDLHVTAIDADPLRARQLGAVADGGVASLRVNQMDATSLAVPDRSFDVVTALEVLEHVRDASQAAREVLRVARRFVVATVPSREDNNPQHLHRLDRGWLEAIFLGAGALRVNVEGIHNHLVATVRVS